MVHDLGKWEKLNKVIGRLSWKGADEEVSALCALATTLICMVAPTSAITTSCLHLFDKAVLATGILVRY